MAKTTDQKIIDTVLEDLPLEHKERLMNSEGEALQGKDMLRIFDQYPTTKNAFLENMVNKVAKTMIYSKNWENPWAELKKEKLEYGDSIEDLFVQMAKMKNFGEHWDTDGTEEGDLIRKIKPIVLALYKTKNIDKKFKTTVFEKDMRKAFTSSNGLSKLVQQIVSSISVAMNFHEFEFMKSTLFRAVDGMNYNGETYVNRHINVVPDHESVVLKKMKAIEITDFENNEYKLFEKMRTVVGQMKYLSKEFNMADQMTFSKPEDLVFITTPEISAKLDVNVLAHAFNVPYVEMKTRIIEVDKFDIRGQKEQAYTTKDDGISQIIDARDHSALPDGKKPLGILIDKAFLDIRDTYQGSGTFYNPEGQYTNYFANREYLMSICLFANSVLFYA